MKSRVVLPLIIIVFLLSCSKHTIEGDRFFVHDNGATMPVIIKGNIESNTVVVFLHGGPGDNASTASFLPVFKELQDDYALAYWDQRGSGLSQGNPENSSFTLEQFVADLDLVVDAIAQRFDDPQIFLYGISWGGALGSAYLSTGNLQNKISGFINMDSGHNLVDGLPLSVKWVQNYAADQIAANVEVDYWTEVYEWCANEPDMTIPENYFQYVPYMRNTNASRMDDRPVESADIDLSVVLNSYMSLSFMFNGSYLRSNFNILELNLSPQMSRITTPTLVIWGRHDGINTIEMAYDAYNSIGPEGFEDKELVILENSAHQGYLEEKEAFQSAFRNFVDTYR